mmetsp:Transcript_3990/g.7649  ORF Transcript_3990/g.7649 Transcript_3990/m.7649 type:complete len:95 (-) Transcript_3990:17-301(-)
MTWQHYFSNEVSTIFYSNTVDAVCATFALLAVQTKRQVPAIRTACRRNTASTVREQLTRSATSTITAIKAKCTVATFDTVRACNILLPLLHAPM